MSTPHPAAVSSPESKDSEIAQLRAENARLRQREQEQQQRAMERQQQRLERARARQRDVRRQSYGVLSMAMAPATPGPAVSALTESAAAALYPATPPRSAGQSVRRVDFVSPLAGPELDDGGSSSDDEEGATEDFTPVPPSSLTSHPAAQGNTDSEKRKRAVIGKALRKVAAPERFKGATADDKDKVEAWCDQMTRYLDGQFYGCDPQDSEVKARRMTLVLNLVDQPASIWLNNMYREELGHSWEDIRPHFIATVREGRDTPAALEQRMDSLAYGRGKCRDLLSFNQEFETLRIRLYPSSSTDGEMSRRSGRDYGAAIRRGDTPLYVEVIKILDIMTGAVRQAELKEWKQATASAVRIRQVEREALRSAEHVNGGRGFRGGKVERAAVNQLQDSEVRPAAANGAAGRGNGAETWQRQEGEEEPEDATGSTQVNVADVRRQGGAGGRLQQRPRFLTEDEMSKLRAAGRCFRCYEKGHRAADAQCQGKGKPQRRPTAEELKA